MSQATLSTSAELFSPSGRADPHPLYEHLRASEPVCRVQLPDGRRFWLVTRYDDVAEALVDPRLSKDTRNQSPEGNFAYLLGDSGAFGRHMLTVDPPDHTRLRALVRKAFSPRLVERLRPRVQHIADDLLDVVADLGCMDLIADYAFPLPIIVITELLGVPPADRDQFRAWSNVMFTNDFSGSREPIRRARADFAAYLRRLCERKRADPGDDLVTGLVQAEESGDALDEPELLGMIWLLLIAGHETTTNLIGNGMLALLHHPHQLALLRENPALIGAAVEELLRYDSPVETSTWRFALEDLELAGQPIAKGDAVLVAISSANRDQASFAHADQLDITRGDTRHLAFGRGIHFCLGAPLARIEGQVAIATLLRRLPRLRLPVGVEDLRWRSSLLLRGLQAFPVEFS
ncbi:MAG: cytochrome P450 family protein [Egibacteraceae bacterium]